MKIGIQIHSLLTPNPILGNVSLAQKNIKHLEKKRLDDFLTKCSAVLLEHILFIVMFWFYYL